MVDFLVTNGGLSVNISDDFGRTPLHDACWTATPSFEVVKIILEINRYMVILCDSRKSLPLSYIHEDHWGSWCEFIMQHKDKYWNISVSYVAYKWDMCLLGVRIFMLIAIFFSVSFFCDPIRAREIGINIWPMYALERFQIAALLKAWKQRRCLKRIFFCW